MLDSWATLSDKKGQYGRSERNQFLTELKFCMRHGVNEPVIRFLVDRAEHDDRLSSCITELLKHIDHPLATIFVATDVARIEKEIEGTDKFSFWVHHCRDDWDPLRKSENRLSDTSRKAILNLWNESEEKWFKKSLLRTWIATTDIVEELASLPHEFSTSRPVLWRRARLGDLSIVDLILERMEVEADWWHVIPPIWTDRFTDPLDRELAALGEKEPANFSGGTSNDHYLLSQVLRDIPLEIAGQQLLKHWESLKFSACFVQVALYIGGEFLLQAADTIIKDAPSDWEPFRHIGHIFGFKTIGLKDRLADKHIDALLPYIDRLSDIDLMEIAEWLVGRGREKDFRTFVSPEINQRIIDQRPKGEDSYIIRVNLVNFPTDADLINALSEIEDDKRKSVWSWCHFATERGDSPERVRTVLRKWFAEQPSLMRLRIVAKIVLELGYREDVETLQKWQAEYGDETTNILVDGAAFCVRYRTLS
jgi:hypothetical protein